jgi:hypothetical protein
MNYKLAAGVLSPHASLEVCPLFRPFHVRTYLVEIGSLGVKIWKCVGDGGGMKEKCEFDASRDALIV